MYHLDIVDGKKQCLKSGHGEVTSSLFKISSFLCVVEDLFLKV